MLSAANNRLNPSSSSSSNSPRFDPSSSSNDSTTPTRPSKRLSRISPSEFDSLLFNNPTETIKTSTATFNEDELGDTSTSTTLESPPITPEKPERDDLKRRSIYRSVGNASSPDLASLVRKHRQQQQALFASTQPEEGLVSEEEEDGQGQYNVESPTKPSPSSSSQQQLRTTSPPPPTLLPYPSPTLSSTTNSTSTATQKPGSVRSRSTTSPEISLHEFAKQSTSSSPQQQQQQQQQQSERKPIFSSPSQAQSFSRGRENTLSTDSNLSTNSSGFVHVPSPQPPPSPSRTLSSTVQALKSQRQLQAPSETTIDRKPSNHSTTSLISTFGLDFGTGQAPLGSNGVSSGGGSPRRKKGVAREQEGEEGKLSLGNTMRKTSRFFRKFGGGGGGSSSSSSSNGAPPSLSKPVRLSSSLRRNFQTSLTFPPARSLSLSLGSIEFNSFNTYFSTRSNPLCSSTRSSNPINLRVSPSSFPSPPSINLSTHYHNFNFSLPLSTHVA